MYNKETTSAILYQQNSNYIPLFGIFIYKSPFILTTCFWVDLEFLGQLFKIGIIEY